MKLNFDDVNSIINYFFSNYEQKEASVPSGIATEAEAIPLCIICFEAPKVRALLPCGHKTCCDECFKDPEVSGMSTCPYCRENVTGTVRVYD
jgi:hypothetical protein